GEEPHGEDDRDPGVAEDVGEGVADAGEAQDAAEHAAGPGDEDDRGDGAERRVDDLLQRGAVLAAPLPEDDEGDEHRDEEGDGGGPDGGEDLDPGLGVVDHPGRAEEVEAGGEEDRNEHRGGERWQAWYSVED